MNHFSSDFHSIFIQSALYKFIIVVSDVPGGIQWKFIKYWFKVKNFRNMNVAQH